MRGRTAQEKLAYWLFADRIPITKLLIVLNVFTFLLIGLLHIPEIVYYLSFSSVTAHSMPWTALTYPLVWVGLSPISLIFAGYWLWVAGGNLERSWGSPTFAVYFFLMSAVSALGLYVGGLLTGIQVGLAGLWLPLAGVTIAFAMMNPEEVILFFFIIPLKLKYLALIDVAMVLVSYGQTHIILGLFALTGCAASYWYVTSGRMLNFGAARYEDRADIIRIKTKRSSTRNLNPLNRYRDYRERKRLKDLFDKSGFED